jgi:pilus assembly protein CpaF
MDRASGAEALFGGEALLRGGRARQPGAALESRPARRATLDGPAYYAAIAAEVAALSERVQAFLDATAALEAEERDRRIRAELVAPAVAAYNARAEARDEATLPVAAAERDIFSRLRRTHGVLAAFFEDDAVTDIYINGPGKPVWVKRAGRLERHDIPLPREEIMGYIDRWQAGASHTLTPVNWRVNVRDPRARISALHEQVGPDGPIVSIRLRPPAPLDLPALVERGLLPAVVARFLAALFVRARRNVFVGGAIGSGKTTLAQALLRALDDETRVLVIEDTRELELGGHVVQLEAHPPQPGDPDRRGEVTMRELVSEALRHGAERIVIGECRGAEAFDMLLAMNLGHEGSITTVHGREYAEILGRIEFMAALAPPHIPPDRLRELIRQTAPVIVVVSETPAGRRVTAVGEVVNLMGATFVVQELLVWEDGRLCSSGEEVSPAMVRAARAGGVDLPALLAEMRRLLPAARRTGGDLEPHGGRA